MDARISMDMDTPATVKIVSIGIEIWMCNGHKDSFKKNGSCRKDHHGYQRMANIYLTISSPISLFIENEKGLPLHHQIFEFFIFYLPKM